MYYLRSNTALLSELVNKQFEMIGEKVKYTQIENGVEVQEGKKKKVVEWWKVYFFETEEQYTEWKEWASAKIRKQFKLTEQEYLNEINYLDLLYGMNVRLKKQGELL